jgi:hypothetical protein
MDRPVGIKALQMNGDLEKIRKEAIVASLCVLSGISMDG